MTCNIEDAGFEIRDQIMWVYGSGFPKSLNISKAIEKHNGVKPIGIRPAYGAIASKELIEQRGWNNINNAIEMPPTQTKEGKQWEGWGTALKPAHEPICVARKPISEKNIAENVLKHGTGGLNIDGCRVGNDIVKTQGKRNGTGTSLEWSKYKSDEEYIGDTNQGRFPANFIHDGSDEVLALFPETAKSRPDYRKDQPIDNNVYFKGWKRQPSLLNDSGSAARFFYCPKASKSERNMGGINNNHCTVKPLSLMQYLVRLVTPPNGIVLDPFLGSGTTAMAAVSEGFRYIGIEREQDYCSIAARRIESELNQTDIFRKD